MWKTSFTWELSGNIAGNMGQARQCWQTFILKPPGYALKLSQHHHSSHFIWYFQSLNLELYYYEKSFYDRFRVFGQRKKFENTIRYISKANKTTFLVFLYLNSIIVEEIFWPVVLCNTYDFHASLIRRVKIKSIPWCQTCAIKKSQYSLLSTLENIYSYLNIMQKSLRSHWRNQPWNQNQWLEVFTEQRHH